MANVDLQTYQTDGELSATEQRTDLLLSTPIPKLQILSNLGLFLNSKNLARILFFNDIYRQIIETQGVIIEFGNRWGQNLGILTALRGIYEPFNRHRKIIGFDTFQGFLEIDEKDKSSDDTASDTGAHLHAGGTIMTENNISVTDGYDKHLEQILSVQEKCNPISHIKKFELRKGDATEQFPQYLKENPETIVAFAFFDFDLYAPTKACLEILKDRLVKGSVVGFDELNEHDAPGETVALMEVMGLNNIRLRKHSHASRVSYFVVE